PLPRVLTSSACVILSSSSRKSPRPAVPYTLSLHDALPISACENDCTGDQRGCAILHGLTPSSGFTGAAARGMVLHKSEGTAKRTDRKSTRLNSSHVKISYAVFCLREKTTQKAPDNQVHTGL